MKKVTVVMLVIVGVYLAMTSCKKQNISDLTSCQWEFVKVENKETAVITKVPQSFAISNKPYLIEFKENGTVNFLTNCNVSTAKYSLTNKNGIKFDSFYPMTEKYCVDLYDWEMVVVDNFSKSLTYSISNKSLIIDCEDNKLYFKEKS